MDPLLELLPSPFCAAHRTNYAIETFILLAHEKCVLSPQMAVQLKWSLTVNTQGSHGRHGKKSLVISIWSNGIRNAN